MPYVVCTSRLEYVGPTTSVYAQGSTVAEVIDNLSLAYPSLKSYLLDDQNNVRKHVAIFVDNTLEPRDGVLHKSVEEQTEIYFMQALSGG